MPIKHLQTARHAAFPCIGKLRKGSAKQVNAKGKEVMGQDLDHFRFVTDDADAASAFAACYGAEPKAINCFLPYATTDENFQAWLEEYRAGGLVRRCDGETCVFHRDAQGRAITAPTPCTKQCGCKQVGRLSVIVPQLARMAYVTVETHSVYDIIQLTENLYAAQALRGDLRGIPFVLSRREREISTPTGDGGRARRKKWLLFIEPDPQWVSRHLEAMRIAALPVVRDPTALEQPTSRMLVDRSTGEIVNTGWANADDDADYRTEAPAALSGGTESEPPPEVRLWTKPDDAYAWAVSIGASENVHAARNAMKSVVEEHGGRLTRENAQAIYTAYYHDRLARAQEKAAAAVDETVRFDGHNATLETIADAAAQISAQFGGNETQVAE